MYSFLKNMACVHSCLCISLLDVKKKKKVYFIFNLNPFFFIYKPFALLYI